MHSVLFTAVERFPHFRGSVVGGSTVSTRYLFACWEINGFLTCKAWVKVICCVHRLHDIVLDICATENINLATCITVPAASPCWNSCATKQDNFFSEVGYGCILNVTQNFSYRSPPRPAENSCQTNNPRNDGVYDNHCTSQSRLLAWVRYDAAFRSQAANLFSAQSHRTS